MAYMVIRLKDAVGAFTSKVSVVGLLRHCLRSGGMAGGQDCQGATPRIDANATTWPDAWAANN